MENKPCNNVEIALVQHRLLDCSAKSTIKPPVSGGKIEFNINLNTPDTPLAVGKDDTFNLGLNITCKGKTSEKNSTMFIASCNIEGTYKVISGEINIAEDDGSAFPFWKEQIDKLCPLISQYLSDMVLKMGYKNVPPLLHLPYMNSPKKKQTPKGAKK